MAMKMAAWLELARTRRAVSPCRRPSKTKSESSALQHITVIPVRALIFFYCSSRRSSVISIRHFFFPCPFPYSCIPFCLSFLCPPWRPSVFLFESFFVLGAQSNCLALFSSSDHIRKRKANLASTRYIRLRDLYTLL